MVVLYARLTCEDSCQPVTLGAALLVLLKTLFDITLLRRGPDTLPAAWLVVVMTLGLWMGGLVLLVLLVPGVAVQHLDTAVLAWAVSVALFALVIVATGHSPRLSQALAAIIGSSAVILLTQVLVLAVIQPLAGEGVGRVLVNLLLLWSVFVKGSIVAQAINVHQLVGVGISIVVYVVRLYVSTALAPV